MALENEVKIEIKSENLSQMRSRLFELGARPLSLALRETNLIFDFDDHKLRLAGCVLRLRRYGKETILTFKGRIEEHPDLKRREELETRVQDFEETKTILNALGLTVHFEYSKIRETYALERGEEDMTICLDQTAVGNFVELEGSAATIQKIAEELGWTSDLFIKKSYTEILAPNADA